MKMKKKTSPRECEVKPVLVHERPRVKERFRENRVCPETRFRRGSIEPVTKSLLRAPTGEKPSAARLPLDHRRVPVSRQVAQPEPTL